MSRLTGIVLSSKQVQLVEPTFGDANMTTADSVVCTLTSSAGVISTTDMTYTADLEKTNTWGWFANVNLPATATTMHIHVEATKGNARGRWHLVMQVVPFT